MSYLLSLPRDSSTAESCWIACTSDRVLALKPDLYDVMVNLPPPFSKDAAEKVYPTVTFSNPSSQGKKQLELVPVKATQRDARRYLHLRAGLGEFARAGASSADNDNADAESTFSCSSIVEPLSWPLLAYTSFIWWASAGEKSSEASSEETEQDARLLLTEDSSTYPMHQPGSSHRSSGLFHEGSSPPQEIAIVTYFRRLTTQIFTVLSDAIVRHDGEYLDAEDSDTTAALTPEHDEDDDNGENSFSATDANEPLLPSSSRSEVYDDDEPVPITTADIMEMGLDPWSEADRAFVETLTKLWFRRRAQVQGAKIRCCGIPIL